MQAAALYTRSCKQVVLVMALVCTIAALSTHHILTIWLSREFADGARDIALILCIGIFANSLAIVPYTLLLALGSPKTTAIVHLFELVLYVIAVWWLASAFGVAGAAWAWVGRATLDLALLHYFAMRELKAMHRR
jgi:O-antigen/teichoic acid export membrane protein